MNPSDEERARQRQRRRLHASDQPSFMAAAETAPASTPAAPSQPERQPRRGQQPSYQSPAYDREYQQLKQMESYGASRSRMPAARIEMSLAWLPKEETVELLNRFHQIPQDYIRAQVTMYAGHYSGQQINGDPDGHFAKWVVKGWEVFGDKATYGKQKSDGGMLGTDISDLRQSQPTAPAADFNEALEFMRKRGDDS